jgi:outer membrane protein OmpA-like peptidoglycan-associated protein
LLSDARSKAVIQFLIQEGIDPARLSYKGYGSSQPIVSDEAIAKLTNPAQIAAAHQKNRRTSYRILP